MTKLTKLLLVSIFSFSTAAIASAQVVINGTGMAHDCYLSAKTGNSGSITAIRTCKEALAESFLRRRDEAATHINLGILLMRKGDNTQAQIHFEKAIALRPQTPEAYINYGASLIYTGKYQAAIQAINTAIELDTKKMPEALFNRAVAYDRLENYKGAYNDLKQALVLRPDWEPALALLSGYQVTTRAKS